MGLSAINFTAAEMREMEEAAEESFRRRPYAKSSKPLQGAYLATLKRMMKHGNPTTIAVIAGVTLEELQRIVE